MQTFLYTIFILFAGMGIGHIMYNSKMRITKDDCKSVYFIGSMAHRITDNEKEYKKLKKETLRLWCGIN